MTDEKNLKIRTKAFALRIFRVFSQLPKTTEAQVMGNRFYVPALQLEQTIERQTEAVVMPSLLQNRRLPQRAGRDGILA